MMDTITYNYTAEKISVKLALGAYTLRERLKFIWMLIAGRVVTLDGPVVLSVRTEQAKQIGSEIQTQALDILQQNK